MGEVKRLPQKEPPPYETCDFCPVPHRCEAERLCVLWVDAGGLPQGEIKPWPKPCPTS